MGGPMKNDPQDYSVRAVERAMQILSTFDAEHPERGVSEIARAVRLHRATTHRIMMTLFSGGFLQRTHSGDKYRLGTRLLQLGLGALRGLDFRRAALPYMEQLVARFEETCDLSIYDRGHVLYVEVVPSPHPLTISARVGRHLPAHCTASGRVFLALLPSEVVEPVLSGPLTACASKTTVCIGRLREELEATRQRGYGLDDEEYEDGRRNGPDSDFKLAII